ncbi:MAG TPA: ABC transporter permease, partial [Gemmatimonadales bacterium]|nr:ABC transporter permease [Gemmatimonadales bacterium]
MLRDLLYAGRALRSTPGSTGAALLAFALGIGATTAVFSVVEGILLRSLPYPQAARLVDIKSSSGTSPFETYEAWRSARDVLDDAAAAVAEQPVLQVERGPERVSAWIVTENFFPLLGATPQFGNGFPRDDRMTAPLAMLSHDFWQSHFGGDPRILDRSLTLDGVNYAIAGVLPAGFLNPVGFRHVRDPDVWLGLGAFRTRADAAEWLARPGFWVIGRLRTGVTPGQAAASLGALNGGTREQQPLVTRLHDSLVGGVRVALLLTVGAVGLVMLVACANVATLLVSRGIARERDMWVRAALGATRARLL